MRIFLAGASGVIGSRLVPLMVNAGHSVAAMTRSGRKAAGLHALGATPVVCDVFDRERLIDEVRRFAPDVVMHQLTDLPDDPAEIPAYAARHNRIRREGTANLLAAATAAAVAKVIAQSVAWPLPGDSGAAVEDLERAVAAYPGLVLRYGQFHGEGTYHPGGPPDAPSVDIDVAAIRTLGLLDEPPGVITIVDKTPGTTVGV